MQILPNGAECLGREAGSYQIRIELRNTTGWDLVQVKYEMLRRARQEGQPVSQVGLSRDCR
jgi:hypothetical protein